MKASRWIAALVSLVVLSAVLGACSTDDAGEATAPVEGEAPDAVSDDVAFTQQGDDSGASVSSSTGGSGAGDGEDGSPGTLGAPDTSGRLSAFGPKVIKTAQLRVQVPRGSFRDSLQESIAAAESVGGYVLSTEAEGRRSRSGTITIRVPAERFEATLGRLKDLGTVDREQISGEDVSEEFIDLEARLRNLEAQERVLLRLMDRAESVAASIRVQRELSRTQVEVERLRGRLRFLEDQTAFSTITARLVEEGVAGPRTAGVLARAWAQAKTAALGVVSAVIIGAGFTLPLLVLLVLALLAWRAIGPRFGKAPAA